MLQRLPPERCSTYLNHMVVAAISCGEIDELRKPLLDPVINIGRVSN